MRRKIIVFLLILGFLAAAGSVFWWWQNQQATAKLNETLPEGVRVVKSLWGDEYKVVNKIDGYELKVPKVWEGLEKIEYTPRNTVEGYVATSLYLIGLKGRGKTMSIDLYGAGDKDEELKTWTEELFRVFDLSGDLEETVVSNIKFLKTIEEKHLGYT
ncbi:MAG: hypothetical protein HY577_02000, partial [Candidatus Nealsonbacteria bacterium]|nr:hypothetical protein [Candidatus Nealsonbacteria bacterium]